MNPAIHHPMWYHYHGLISKEELDQAINDDKQVSSRHASQIPAGNIYIACIDERWEIRCQSEAHRTRLAEITVRLFDDLLKQTIVGRIGVNNDFTLHVKDERFRNFFSQQIATQEFGMNLAGVDIGGGCYLSVPIDGGLRRIEAQTTRGKPTQLRIAINSDRNCNSDRALFDLKPFFDEYYNQDYNESVAIRDALKIRVNEQLAHLK